MSHDNIGYDDMRVSVAEGNRRAGLTYEAYRNTGFWMSFMRHNQDDELHITLQMSHRKRKGVNMGDMHFHLVPMSVPVLGVSDHVYFTYEYTWFNVYGDIPDTGSWVSGTKTWTVPVTGQYEHFVVDILEDIAPPANESYSSIMLLRVTREGTNPLDTYDVGKSPGTAAANLGILSLDAHVQMDRQGSYHEFWD